MPNVNAIMNRLLLQVLPACDFQKNLSHHFYVEQNVLKKQPPSSIDFAVGLHDGTHLGKRYFKASGPQRGAFVPVDDVLLVRQRGRLDFRPRYTTIHKKGKLETY